MPPARTLWLVPRPRRVPDGDIAVVIDATWTPPAADGPLADDEPRGVIPIRDTVGGVLGRLDVAEASSRALDAWAAASGVVPRLTIGDTSFWFYVRLRHWHWLQKRVLWAAVLRAVLDEHRPTAIVCDASADSALLLVAQRMAAADGIPCRIDGDPAPDTPATATPAEAGGNAAAASPPAPASPRDLPAYRRLARRVVRRLRGGAPGPGPATPDADPIDARLARLAAETERRLIVVLTQLPQRIVTADGPRVLNPYLGPVVDRLQGTRLEPIVVDWRATRSDAEAMARLAGPGMDRVLPIDAVRRGEVARDPAAADAARAAAEGIARLTSPCMTSGVDLGPDLAAFVADDAARWFPGVPAKVAGLRRLLERLPAAGILLADEYHRQDCLEAAGRAGIPVAAIQHGVIHRRHPGYVHAGRPPSLHLPARTYLFGRWERDLLVEGSVYRDDEVVVTGSPRLDLYRPAALDREAVRAELGAQPGERLVVLSGTYGSLYRRFHYPVVLARLFDRPLPGVRVVVKQHPAEDDEGPYRAVIEGVARARGFAPPPIVVVRDVDLYRLLAAADAHLGVLSTVLTEAVFVGTPNLLASGIAGGDLLDYVAAGVALPVTTGEELLAALDAAAAGAITAEARAAFIADHFEAGSGTDRVAQDLLAWLV